MNTSMMGFLLCVAIFGTVFSNPELLQKRKEAESKNTFLKIRDGYELTSVDVRNLPANLENLVQKVRDSDYGHAACFHTKNLQFVLDSTSSVNDIDVAIDFLNTLKDRAMQINFAKKQLEFIAKEQQRNCGCFEEVQQVLQSGARTTLEAFLWLKQRAGQLFFERKKESVNSTELQQLIALDKQPIKSFALEKQEGADQDLTLYWFHKQEGMLVLLNPSSPLDAIHAAFKILGQIRVAVLRCEAERSKTPGELPSQQSVEEAVPVEVSKMQNDIFAFVHTNDTGASRTTLTTVLSPHAGDEKTRINRLRTLVDAGFSCERAMTYGAESAHPSAGLRPKRDTEDAPYTMLEIVVDSLFSQCMPPFPDMIHNQKFVPALLALGAPIDATRKALIKRGWSPMKVDQFFFYDLLQAEKPASDYALSSEINTCLLNSVLKLALASKVPEYKALCREPMHIENAATKSQFFVFLPSLHNSDEMDNFFQTMVKNGAQIEIADNIYGMTACMWAAALGCTPLIDSLIRIGGTEQLFVRDHFGATALHYAARNGHARMIQLLLKLAGTEARKLAFLEDNNVRIGLDYFLLHDHEPVIE